ncbi:helix-turn-helix domain-containing protein [Iamia majanohamensis]|uniref:Helix-turn-helix domain-containing protein n=1 Tax=Iamia majanohamensis TaxID=467976 RepID=A0AAE9Y3I2_9ACTN|nr:helix-turn-helix domain-containing protein [Iamia majanohamensis]WCO65810.1 helix-turn-helix domain-containing protein [Iamia majanohamensis]
MPRRRPPPGPPAVRPDPMLVRAVERVGDRWVLLIVAGLMDGPRRFGDLGDGLGVAPNILTARLRQLEEDGLVVARPYSERPVRHEYALTGAGRELAATLAHLSEWGARRRGGPTGAAFHSRCGATLEVRAWCPTCDRTVEGEEAAEAYDV